MNVIQSYMTTVMRGNFSIYEVRIFMKIVELANQVLKGQKISKLLGKALCADGINCNLTIPVRELMTEGSFAYDRVKKALLNLMHKEVKMYFPEQKEWRATTLLNNIRFAEHDGMVKFVVPKWLLEYILNFINKQFSAYDLQTALQLPTPYSVRLYWLTCSMTDSIEFPIEMLRQMLGTDGHYPKTKDFIKRCIIPAQEILATRNLNGFTFKKIFEKNRIKGLLITPVKRQAQEPKQLVAMAGLNAWCNPVLKQYLTSQVGFTARELQANKDTLFEFGRVKDWQETIVRIVNRQRKKRASKGYVINAMRLEIQKAKPVQNEDGK